MKSFKKLSRLMLSTQKGSEKDRNRDCKLTPMGGLAQDSHNMTRGMQELRDMASRYQGLVTVSAQLAASAYEFSGAVQNLGSYCVKHFGSMENDDIGKIFETVGRVQLEISKSLDLYGSHVSQTIVIPTESLLSELRHLEDAKRQHEAKRQALDEVRCNIIKGKTRNPKVDDHMESQMRQAKEECEELAVFIGCRLLSLEHGRPRSLITQAARHYTAQVQLFGTVLEVLQGIDRYMKSVMQERNIDNRLNSTANADSVVDNHVIPDFNSKEPARLNNFKTTAAMSSVEPKVDTDEPSTQGSYEDTGGVFDNVQENPGVEKDVALWLQQDNIAIVSAPTSPAKCKADDTIDETASAFGPPPRRPPTVHVDHVLVCPLPSSAIVSGVGDMPSDSHGESPSLGVGGKLRRSPPGNKKGGAMSLLSQKGHQKDTERTVGTSSLHPLVVRLGVRSFSPSGAAGARSQMSSASRPWPAEAGASRTYSQAGPEPAPSRRYSQSGPLTFTGTPWPSASKGTTGAARSGKDPTAAATAARSPGVTKLQISELHKLPAPPRGTTSAATRSPAPAPASVGRGMSTRSGPLFKSHEDFGATRGRTCAQQQLLAAAAQGCGPVSRSLSLPSSTQNLRTYSCPQPEEPPCVAQKLSRPARKENLPSRALI